VNSEQRMKVERDQKRVVISNNLVELRAELTAGEPGLTLSAMQDGYGFVPVLKRIGKNKTQDALRAEVPQDRSGSNQKIKDKA